MKWHLRVFGAVKWTDLGQSNAHIIHKYRGMKFDAEHVVNLILRSAAISSAVFLFFSIIFHYSLFALLFLPVSKLVVVISVPPAMIILALRKFRKYKGRILTSLQVPDWSKRMKLAAKGAGFAALPVWLAANMYLVEKFNSLQHDFSGVRVLIVGGVTFILFFVPILLFLWGVSIHWKSLPARFRTSAFKSRISVLILLHKIISPLFILLAVLLWYFFVDRVSSRPQIIREMSAANILVLLGSSIAAIAALFQALFGTILRSWVEKYKFYFDPRHSYNSFGEELFFAFIRNLIWLGFIALAVLVFAAITLITALFQLVQ